VCGRAALYDKSLLAYFQGIVRIKVRILKVITVFLDIVDED